MTTPDGSTRARLATAWLGGCSGCHMSLLDLDELLVPLSERADVVYGPLIDTKVFPSGVDLTLVEGSVTNTDNVELAHAIRANSTVVVSFGDCAVTGNITALRNALGEPAGMLQRVYAEHSDLGHELPVDVVPEPLPKALPLHEVVDVDVFLPGCPPSASRIATAVFALLDAMEAGEDVRTVAASRSPDQLRFGN